MNRAATLVHRRHYFHISSRYYSSLGIRKIVKQLWERGGSTSTKEKFPWCTDARQGSIRCRGSRSDRTQQDLSLVVVASRGTTETGTFASLLAFFAVVTVGGGIQHKVKDDRDSSSSPCSTTWIRNTRLTYYKTTQCDARSPSNHATMKTGGGAVFQVSDLYVLEQILGRGACGVVVQARRKSDHAVVALKMLNRQTTDMNEYHRETKALQCLAQHHHNNANLEEGGHRHVCRLYDLHQDEKNYYLVMELIPGGELFEHLILNGAYSEAQAATFVRQCAEALCFIHSAGVVHGDVKPENLMMSLKPQPEQSETQHPQQQQQLKVVDFGCAVIVEDEYDQGRGDVMNSITPNNPTASKPTDKSPPSGDKLQQIGGTPAYWSPELVVNASPRPTRAADMWAAGCIVYILLTGTHPFDKFGDASDKELVDMIRHVALDKDMTVLHELVFDERLDGLSDSCVQLMKQLMHPDPMQRMTSEEFLRHPWVQGLTASWTTMQDSHRKLEAFWQGRFRTEVLKRYGTRGALSDRNLVEIFRCMDLNGDGVIEPDELEVVFRDLGVQRDDVLKIFQSVDLDGSGEIDLDEFKTIMRKAFGDGPDLRVYHRQMRFHSDILRRFGSEGSKTLSEEELRDIFHSMDLDGNGVLDPHEIRVVLRTAGEDEDYISQIVASVDLDHDGGVSWVEFRAIMRGYDES